MIKIGIAGTGFMGNMHAECYKALAGTADFQVTAIADVDSERAAKLAEQFGAQTYSSVEEMLEHGDINTVDICLPTFLHTDAALKAMDKGYNVFIEKPVCLNMEEAAQLLSKQQQTNTRVMVGQCIRFWPEYKRLRELIDNRTYGSVISGVFRRISPRPEWAWQEWLHDPSRSGSAALDLHIHDVDFVRSVLGNPDRIQTEIVRRQEANVHIHSLYRYGDVVISLEGGWDYPSGFPFEMAYTVQLEQATAVFSSKATPSLTIYEAGGRVIEESFDSGADTADEKRTGNISSLGGYYNELNYFLQAIQHNRAIEEATLQDGCDSVELLYRALKAT
ncbi:MAG: oxidoreductase [Paenibacillus sp.]|jgi:predicted dehydrogenase|nr:oxidoreductase [Paenibacillus sp.]